MGDRSLARYIKTPRDAFIVTCAAVLGVAVVVAGVVWLT
jgi:hypothetical protein